MTFTSVELRGSYHLMMCSVYILYQMAMQEKFPGETVMAGE